MAHDDSVFLMGEEVGQYQGAYKVQTKKKKKKNIFHFCFTNKKN